jgi:type II secretory pathway pseudopilin PulG
VELLVVIGIIALLISILLPTLARARSAAENVQCLANLRSMGQALQIYISESKGWIPGSAATSGRGIIKPDYTAAAYSATNVPEGAVIDGTDYFAPLAKMMRLTLPNANSPSAAKRYQDYMSLQPFQCPSYKGVLAGPYAGAPDAGYLQSISYNTAWCFLVTAGNPTPGLTSYTRMSTGATWPVLPSGYTPKINKIGQGAEKVYAADGAKFATKDIKPDYNLTIQDYEATTTYGCISNYSDFGPWNQQTSSYDRTYAPGNGTAPAGTFDPRKLAMRHGGKGAKNLRMNMVFYDGHADSMYELDAANPKLWLPKGSGFSSGLLGKTWTDVIKKYGVSATTIIN